MRGLEKERCPLFREEGDDIHVHFNTFGNGEMEGTFSE
jgi:hypothetical protein